MAELQVLGQENIDPEFLLTDRRDSLIHASSGSPLCDSLELGTGHTGRSARGPGTQSCPPDPYIPTRLAEKSLQYSVVSTVRTQAHRREGQIKAKCSES